MGPYKASKFLAERVADELAARGAPIVIVNPSAPIGPWDVKPTPTGQMVVDFLKGKMVGSVDTAGRIERFQRKYGLKGSDTTSA